MPRKKRTTVLPQPIETVDGWVEIPTDCWISPPLVDRCIRRVWPNGVDLDPFWDPNSIVQARGRIDRRRGEDAYALDLLAEADVRGRSSGRRMHVNSPYSGDHPARTAELLSATFDRGPCSILNLCPAAPGSDYWRSWVWPLAPSVAWMGRLSFVAGRDLLFPENHERAGEVRYHAGELVDGNRTEIAWIMFDRDERAHDRFRRVLSLEGYHVTRG